MRNHQVRFVQDEALPDGMDWVLAQAGERNIVFIKESADLALVLCEAWTVFHRNEKAAAAVPAPRRSRRIRVGPPLVLWPAGALAAVAVAAVAGAEGFASMEGFPLWSSTGATVTAQWLHLLQL